MTAAPTPIAESAADFPVTVVIVNYRTAKLVVDCLHSLCGEVQRRPSTRVVVVDNASGDDSASTIAHALTAHGWSGWARLLPAPRNGGFAYGNNLVVRESLTQSGQSSQSAPPAAFWLLNPDTRVHAGALDALADFLQAHPQAGIVGSALEEADGQPWPYAFRFPSVLSEIEGGMRLGMVARLLARHAVAQRMGPQPARVDWLSGASMMVRSAVFADIGLMDEGFFLYFEETDFARRAHARQWQSWYVPASRVLHISGQSTGVTGAQEGQRRRPAYWFNSRRRYFVKHHGRAYAVATDAALWLSSLSCWARHALLRRADPDPPQFLADLLRHSALLRR